MLTLSVLPERLGICRLSPDDDLPAWITESSFLSITRTSEELSIVCVEQVIPEGTTSEKGWRCLKVHGPLDFSLTGILSSLLYPLAKANISVFALSTYDTDYLLVKETDLERAKAILVEEGHKVFD
jgi:hypothetical protein